MEERRNYARIQMIKNENDHRSVRTELENNKEKFVYID